ncbi:MAG: hypothetical protein ACE5I9_11805 [Candidatus Methylomirabilales bacterium]
MDKREKVALLKTLTAENLREICRLHDIQGYAGLKQRELASLVAEDLDLPDQELEALVDRFRQDKLIAKIRDGRDYFCTKQVEVRYHDDELVKAKVGGYSVTISNLGRDTFSYTCDEKCQDFLYQVSKGRYPFCKHYPAVLAQLLLTYEISPNTTQLNHVEGPVLQELMEIVERQRKEEVPLPEGRDIPGTLKRLEEDYFKIARQDAKLARDKYHDVPERVFEALTEQAFQLLEFDTILQRRTHGWDLLLIAGRATPPYVVVAECKTATSGIYDTVLRDPDYLIRLKSYCLDMVRDRLVGAYRDAVRYLALIAPGFPDGIEGVAQEFQRMAGIQLSCWPGPILLELIVRYRNNPIIPQTILERLFRKGGVVDSAGLDEVFELAERHIELLVKRAREKLRQRFQQFAQTSADACFLKLNTTT